jgi:hypothetical protein
MLATPGNLLREHTKQSFILEASMKKFLVLVLMFVVLAFAAPSASAQTRHRRHRHGRTFWQKHRDKLTVAGTTLGGAGIGGLAGGKKGALIGAGAGAGTGALYTYKIRKRHRRRY